jgi:hypothetical protein
MENHRVTSRWISLRLAIVLCLLAAPSLAVKLSRADAQSYLDHVKYLASDELKGRGAGTPGLDMAAEYIARQFKAAGLEPAGKDGAFFQPFTVTTGARMGSDNHFVTRHSGGERALKPGDDYIPLNFSSDAAVSGPLVFAGYGVSANEFNYDDYTHFDVKDKIVVVLRYEPEGLGREQGFGKDKRRTYHAHLITKAINARNRGAKAVVLVNGKLEGDEKDELLKFGGVSGPDDAGIVMVQVANTVAAEWLKAAGKSLEAVQAEIDQHKMPASFSLPESLTISLEVDIEREQATVRNVLGYLPGASKEYVIIGAHYDHLGLGDQSSLAPSQIGEPHHGADDNASGTAGVIELARLFAARRDSLGRGVLFMAFAGEEIGLLGSSQWVKEPTLPLENAKAMVNMDMIGRIKDSKIYVGGVGTGSTFKKLLEETTRDSGFQIDYSVSGYSASDHTSFVGKQIPVLFFFSGLHGDYHKPSDTWDKINAKDAARLLDLVGETASSLVSAGNLPQFVKVEGAEHGGDARGSGSGGGGYGPYFGSIPDFGQVETGVKFADVRAGSPADKAGLRAGDILTRFGESPIKNLYDFTYALRAAKVGDVVPVTVLRDGKEVTAAVTLEQRR